MKKQNVYSVSMTLINSSDRPVYIVDKEVRAYSEKQARYFIMLEYRGRGFIRDMKVAVKEDNSSNNGYQQMSLF